MRRLVHSLLIVSACLGLLAACGDDPDNGSAAADNADPIVIGSTNFPEQLILANIYADVLEARGFEVEKRLNLGSREIVFPALESGEIDVMPEYTGALLAYLTDEEGGEHEQQDVADAVQENLPAGLVMLDISPAEDKDALVVTAETAEKHDLN
ncbi:MAG TPA: glycine betaine ABC transporter substrate-binding protein, partial [Salinisphaeraceae bacterium]|nr:glycine betaine ABC transporter substrate-binding protein [Salinisphaeraceae bacterium]